MELSPARNIFKNTFLISYQITKYSQKNNRWPDFAGVPSYRRSAGASAPKFSIVKRKPVKIKGNPRLARTKNI